VISNGKASKPCVDANQVFQLHRSSNLLLTISDRSLREQFARVHLTADKRQTSKSFGLRNRALLSWMIGILTAFIGKVQT
jgi:hypothetical protein